MMDNFLSGFGLIACIGAVVLFALFAIAIRAFLPGRRANRRDDVYNQQYPGPVTGGRDLRDQGTERPTYDSGRIESSGGFGGTPVGTGRYIDPLDDPSRGDVMLDPDDAAFRGPERDIDRDSSARGPLRDRDVEDANRMRRERRRMEDDDDDNIRSGGGFGQ